VLNKNKENLRTLKLDAAWRPIEIISADRGFSMVYSGRAKAVENYSYGPCARFLFPSIIVLTGYVRRKHITVRPSRKNIYWRDKNTCQYCGKTFWPKELSLDHVIPKSRGGDKSWLNLVTSCHPCNQKKGDKSPQDVGMELIRIPFIPKMTVFDLHQNSEIPENWLNFI